ncbi:MAG: heme exporter protein CcmB [Acidobacteriota bacterium]|nr:heme exporter protein CcmB [Acidobacteriota bacterium]MDH3785094.1 heme exporter protein CcmB [Acidobacteriota bacterium]
MHELRCIWTIARKDLLTEWRTLDRTVGSLVFALIVLVVFQFAFALGDASPTTQEQLLPGVLWTLIAFMTVVALSRSMLMERRRDTLLALAVSPAAGTAVYLGKLVAGLVQLTVLLAVTMPLAALLYDYPLAAHLGPLVGVIALHGFGFTVLGTLFSGVVARLDRGEALLATLLFPAITPLLLSGIRCTGAVLSGDALETYQHWLLMGAGFDMLYVFVALATFEFILQD